VEYLQAQERLVTIHALMSLAEEKRKSTWGEEKGNEVQKKSKICPIS